MIEKLANFMERHLSEPMNKLAQQRHLRAVRDGIIATLPLIIVGSFFLIIAIPPLPQDWAIYQFLTANAGKILLPYRMSMMIMTLYAVFGIGSSLAKSYGKDGITGGILAELALLLTIVPVSVSADASAGVSGWVLPMTYIGSSGMFVGIIVSIIAVEIYRVIDNSGFKITMPEQVPPAVARSFEALTPTAAIILLIGGITYFLGFNWHGFVGTLVAPLISATDTLPSVLLITFLITLFWSFGIHGASIVGTLARPLWLVLLEQNATAAADGAALPAIAAEPFYQWFIWVGGAGCTIGLAILLAFRAKSKYGKTLGRTSILPVLFNINEPIIFGAPIVMNPVLMIPFILAPMTCAIIAWFATTLGLVNAVVVTAPWTLPGPIGAYLATGGDYRATILSIFLIVVSILIYYPFFKIYDKKQMEEEA